MTLPRFLMTFALLAVLLVGSACEDDDNGDGATTPVVGTPAANSTAGVPRIQDEDGLSTVEIAELLRPSIVRVQTEIATIDALGRVIPGEGVGTGVIIDEAGYIVTNNHVVTGRNGATPADTIRVTLSDQRTFDAAIVGRDQPTDLAVLQIDADDLVAASFGSSEELRVGQDVVAIGFALGLEGAPTVTRGVVSAKNRTIDETPFTIPDAVQTDAGINPGNSGGPLVNARGEIVGINTAIIRGAQNIGFSIAADLVRPTVEQLIEEGEIRRAYIGIGTVDVTPGIARSFDLPVESGIAVTQVEAGAPASRSDLRANDVIVAIDGQEIDNNGELLAFLAQRRPGDTVTLEYYRGQERRETDVTLVARPN